MTSSYVISDGHFIGDFEGLYREVGDPWEQSTEKYINSSRRRLAIHWTTRLRQLRNCQRVLDIGCGYGHMAAELASEGFGVVGVDISATAIREARRLHRGPTFLCREIISSDLLDDIDADIILMSEVTWYLLDKLHLLRDGLVAYAANRDRPTYLIHLLETYEEGVQQYGRDFFTDLTSILTWWSIPWIEAGVVSTQQVDGFEAGSGTYFIGRLN